jgi:hypothetical protein
MRALLACVIVVLLAACGPSRRSEPTVGPFEPANNDKPLPVLAMKTQVRVGVGAMPGFPEGEISDKELDDLMVYLKALRRHHGVKEPD